MRVRRGTLVLIVIFALIWGFNASCNASTPDDVDPTPPSAPVKLIFIHHSCGENWLADYDGGLGAALRDSNYYVSDTNYGWGPDSIGDATDIGHWWSWFCGPDKDRYLSALFAESEKHSEYSRLYSDPGGENEIVMFKSCYPNSGLGGDPNQPPPAGDNPLRGEGCDSPHHTVANAKGIYNDLLDYFATRQEKLFVVVTAPPQEENEADPASADNARAFNNWLVEDWLDDYPYKNVAVFDFYNVLTSNGGDIYTNDLGLEAGNHHRVRSGNVEHIQTVESNLSAYGTGPWDSHPTSAGNEKATAEFVPLLNVFYNQWIAGESALIEPEPKIIPPTDLSLQETSPEPSASELSASEPPASLDIPLTVKNILDVPRKSEPVTSGVPIPREINLRDISSLRLLDSSSEPVAAQFTPLARWGGAPGDERCPVTWLLIDFQADVPASSEFVYHLVKSDGDLPTFPALVVTDEEDVITIDTGAARFTISKTDGNLRMPDLESELTGRAIAPDGGVYTTEGPVRVKEALKGPMRVSVQVEGAYKDEAGLQLLNHTTRYWFYAGMPLVRIFHTAENNNLCPLAEFEQLDCYDIGSGNSVSIEDLSLLLTTNLNGDLGYEVASEDAPLTGELKADLLLYQDSSGTDFWDKYPEMTDWYGDPLDAAPRMQSYVNFRGYQTLLNSEILESGDQSPGWLSISGDDGLWTVAVCDFWESFPKSLRASAEGAIEIGLFPEEFGPSDYSFSLRAGEHKTHEIVIVSPSARGEGNNDWGLRSADSLFAAASPEWYVESGAVPFLSYRSYDHWPDYELYLDYQLDTAPTYEEWMDWYPNLLAAIERTDFYGIFDYGDWPIDYEGYGVSPLNSKYDNFYGAWLQWMRSGDARWFDLADSGNRHASDLDILHNIHSPRHWGDGISFGHSYHDEEGFCNPHRNYGGNHPDTAFGVPGMLLTYYLTGYEKAYDSTLELADCIEYRLRNDEHLSDYFPPEESNGQGYALDYGLYGGGCRPAANCLKVAVSAYRATADPRYLRVADSLVDWAKPEDQPYINGPDGEDQMMRPWMLNMYLRSLAEYIEMKEEFGSTEADLQGARDSYQGYANWLRTYPWIDLDPIETGPRGAYPYEWWFDNRTDIPGEENDNLDASINSWLLLGADSLAYAYHLSGDSDYMERATGLFRAGSRDPWFVDDPNTYSSTKETANAIVWGQVFLHEWQKMNGG